MNDTERGEIIINDEGLYNWQRSSRLPMRQFIKANREAIDQVINKMLGRGPTRPDLGVPGPKGWTF